MKNIIRIADLNTKGKNEIKEIIVKKLYMPDIDLYEFGAVDEIPSLAETNEESIFRAYEDLFITLRRARRTKIFSSLIKNDLNCQGVFQFLNLLNIDYQNESYLYIQNQNENYNNCCIFIDKNGHLAIYEYSYTNAISKILVTQDMDSIIKFCSNFISLIQNTKLIKNEMRLFQFNDKSEKEIKSFLFNYLVQNEKLIEIEKYKENGYELTGEYKDLKNVYTKLGKINYLKLVKYDLAIQNIYDFFEFLGIDINEIINNNQNILLERTHKLTIELMENDELKIELINSENNTLLESYSIKGVKKIIDILDNLYNLIFITSNNKKKIIEYLFNYKEHNVK
ncbi:hypothetical protein [Streptobacillus canis]|uniref:hypothetical protein n=1 Tax=Streptobacillus canis TaxID=2678686 RepID=UPI0012E31EE0|nr:hypothetical protein [Streptobacillus canis]